MKFALPALSFALLVWASIWLLWPAPPSTPSRAITVRFTAFAWLLALLLSAGALFLPGKGRAVLLLAALFLSVTVVRAWQRSHARARLAERERANFERARPLN